MRRRGAWRIGTGGSNLFFILPRLDCPLRRRRRASGRAATTTAGRRQAPAADATGPPDEAAPRPLGLPPAGRDSPRAVAPERLVGGVGVPICGSQIAPFNFGLAPQHGKNSSFAVRGLLRAARHASTGRSTARSNSRLSIHLGRGTVNTSSSLAVSATRGQKLQNLGGPTPFRQKRWIALEAPSPASAAQHCSLPFEQRRARRRVDRGLSYEPHC